LGTVIVRRVLTVLGEEAVSGYINMYASDVLYLN